MLSRRTLGTATLLVIALVSALARAQEAPKPDGLREIDGTFQSYDDKTRLLTLRPDIVYQLTEEAAADKDNITVIESILARKVEQKVTLGMKGGKVARIRMKLAAPKLGEKVDPKIAKLLEETRAGDIVEFDEGKGPCPGKFISIKAGMLWYYAPEVGKRGPDGKPIYNLKTAMAVSAEKLTSFKNFSADERKIGKPPEATPGPTPEPGVPETDDLREGDTISIGFEQGRLEAITDDSITLRPWLETEGRFGPPGPRERKQGTERVKIKIAKLLRTPPSPDARIVLQEERWHARNRMFVELDVSHAQKDMVLADATILLRAGKRDVKLSEKAEERQERTLPVLFADEHWRERAQFDEREEAETEMQLDKDRNFVPIQSEPALQLIKLAIARRAASGRVDDLRHALLAAARNKHESLARILVDLHIEASGPVADKVRAAVEDALAAFGPEAAAPLIDDVLRSDGQFSLLGLDAQGQDVRREISMLPAGQTAAVAKSLILRLLQGVTGALSGDRAMRLFDLSQQRGELAPPIAALVAARPEEGVPILLQAAVAIAGRTNPTQEAEARASGATSMLRSLGRKGAQSVVDAVRALDGPAAASANELQSALVAAKKPEQVQLVIEEGIRVAADAKVRERNEAVERALGEARTLASQDPEAALAKLQWVLAETNGEQQDAKKMLPGALVSVGRGLEKAGKRGEAALRYRECLKLGAAGSGAKPPLGRILLESAKEAAVGPIVREGPDDAFKPFPRSLAINDRLPVASWRQTSLVGFVPVFVDKEKTKIGFIRSSIVSKTPVEVTVLGNVVIAEARRLLGEARGLSAEIGAQADLLEATVYLDEAERRRDAEDYQGALVMYDNAQKLNPEDPRLAGRTSVWLRVNRLLFLLLGGITLVAAAFVALAVVRRQKRVRHEGDYLYYGKERARMAREIDAKSEVAASPPEGAAAPPAPAGDASAPTAPGGETAAPAAPAPEAAPPEAEAPPPA